LRYIRGNELLLLGTAMQSSNLNLYPSLNIVVIKSRTMEWVGRVACMGEMRNAYKILVRKLEGKRLLGIPRCR